MKGHTAGTAPLTKTQTSAAPSPAQVGRCTRDPAARGTSLLSFGGEQLPRRRSSPARRGGCRAKSAGAGLFVARSQRGRPRSRGGMRNGGEISDVSHPTSGEKPSAADQRSRRLCPAHKAPGLRDSLRGKRARRVRRISSASAAVASATAGWEPGSPFTYSAGRQPARRNRAARPATGSALQRGPHRHGR